MFSQAAEVAHHLEQHRTRARAFAAAYVLFVCTYLIWRLTIFNPYHPVLSVIFYMADLYFALQGFLFIWNSWSVRRREPPAKDYRPTVDVFLPVYTEPVEMIELTLKGALAIDYPHQTFLLDDGRRPELKALAERLGARYVIRADNKGAKAGNLNNALKLSTAEAIAVFDADHIPKRESLDMLVGYLKDPKVAVSQAPQMFYNEDGFLYRDIFVGTIRWHEQSHFMHVTQGLRDFHGASTCVGTGCVYRRKIIDEIGGFPEATLTEDLHSAIIFHKHGYETVWVNEPVAWGIAAADISEYYKTRRRWTYGNLQAFSVENILWTPELSPIHRLIYIGFAFNLFAGWFQLVYVIVPIMGILGNITPFSPSVVNLVILTCAPAVMIYTLLQSCAGFVRFLPSQIFSMGSLFMQIECTRGLFGRKMKWQISLKNVLGKVQYGKLFMHILLLIGSGLALLYSALRLLHVVPEIPGPHNHPILLVLASAWVMLNSWRSWRWITDSVRLTRRTHREYLFEAQVPVLDQHGVWLGSTSRLSTVQLELHYHNPQTQPPVPGDRLQLLIPGHTISVIVQPGGSPELVEVQAADATSLEKLRCSLYSVDWHRMVKLSKHSFMAKAKGLAGNWQPVLLMGEQPRWALKLPPKAPHTRARLMLEGTQLSPGTVLSLQEREANTHTIKKYLIAFQTDPLFPVPRGLNNNAFYFFEIDLAE